MSVVFLHLLLVLDFVVHDLLNDASAQRQARVPTSEVALAGTCLTGVQTEA